MINSSVGDVDAVSYVSLSYANKFMEKSVDNASWPTDDDYIEAALVEATRILDSQFDWYGEIVLDSPQALRWPRENAYDEDSRLIAADVIPKKIMDATCYLAYFLVKSGGLSQTQSDLKALKIGPINLQFNDGKTAIGVPKFIAKMLQVYGMFNGVIDGSAYSVQAMRS